MKKTHLISRILILIAGLASFFFIAAKANSASFTHDESYSYNSYVHNSFMDIISHKNSYTNNHLLNTLLMKYSERMFGASEIALRLPNLIMMLVFCAYLFLILKRCNSILGASIFILAVTNVGLLDFFGLARGYGISIGFMIMGIYHLIQSFFDGKKIHLVLFNIAALMAILGNFTMLDFYVAAIIIYNGVCFYEYRFVLKAKFNIYKINKINLLLFLCILVILYEPVRRVITYNQFDFGGTQGFMNDTMHALVSTLFINLTMNPFEICVAEIGILVLLAVPLFILIKQTYRRNTDFFENNKPLVIVNGVLLTIFLEIIIQHLLLKTDYLVGRFALFLFPLLVLNIGFLLEYFLKFKIRKVILGISMAVAIVSTINFYRHADLYSCAEWGYDMETKRAINELITWHDKYDRNNNNVKLSNNWLFEPTINFYRTTLHLNWLLPVDRKELTLNSDYYYVFKTDLENLKPEKYSILFSSERTNTVLIKRELQ
jgi:hypothetical protein